MSYANLLSNKNSKFKGSSFWEIEIEILFEIESKLYRAFGKSKSKLCLRDNFNFRLFQLSKLMNSRLHLSSVGKKAFSILVPF